MDLRALLSERDAQINTLHDIQSVSRPGMDKPAESLTLLVRVPIGAIFTRHNMIVIVLLVHINMKQKITKNVQQY